MNKKLEIKYFPKGAPSEVIEKLIKSAEIDADNIRVRYDPNAEIRPENYFEFMLKHGNNYIAFIGDEPVADVSFYVSKNMLAKLLVSSHFYIQKENGEVYI
jgi:hypothetical protein